MRKLISSAAWCALVIVALAAVATSPPAEAQERDREFPRASPSAAVSQVVGVTEITITYGRPSVRGRTVFGELVPYGEVWRAGANEATTITLTDDVLFGEEDVPAGTYALFTIPGEEEWTIILNDEAEQWGAFGYDSSRDVARIPATPEEAGFREMMTFFFEEVDDSSATIVLHWDEVRVPFEVRVDTDAIILDRARDAAASDSWQEPLGYATYALQNDVHLEEALGWVERSIELRENYSNLLVKARLLGALGRYSEAVRTGEQAIQHTEEGSEEPASLGQLRQAIEAWRAAENR